MEKNILTCVYCGMAYPEGTPPHGSQILTDHIKICKEHPMRQAEATILKLRSALVGLVGASNREELEVMKAVLQGVALSEADKVVGINAMNVLIETEGE